jgi:metal-responsive CopG/Arc/MetJ family transcriptional regulator
VSKKDKHDIERLREEILSKLDPDVVDAKKHIIAVMARLDSRLVEFLDALVKLKICNSRSDAVASIIKQAILTQPDVFEQVRTQARKLGEIEETTKTLAKKAVGK